MQHTRELTHEPLVDMIRVQAAHTTEVLTEIDHIARCHSALVANVADTITNAMEREKEGESVACVAQPNFDIE